jgi:hypothetical protein
MSQNNSSKRIKIYIFHYFTNKAYNNGFSCEIRITVPQKQITTPNIRGVFGK